MLTLRLPEVLSSSQIYPCSVYHLGGGFLNRTRIMGYGAEIKLNHRPAATKSALASSLWLIFVEIAAKI
jgi:hypothetical protein